MKITAVKDLKADLFLTPSFQRSIADAIRSWEVVANEGDSLVSRFPQDFVLYHLGDFDAETGRITLSENPTSLGSAYDFKKKPQEALPLPMQKNSN